MVQGVAYGIQCYVMHAGKGNKKYNYYMDGRKLDVIHEERDLEMWMTEDLKASTQCVQACARANQVLV